MKVQQLKPRLLQFCRELGHEVSIGKLSLGSTEDGHW
jgi:hypothetical protein